MKRILPIIMIFCSITMTALAQKAPELTLKQVDHNFGKIKEGAIVKHDFYFTNTGNSTLVIKRVDKSCGCTTPVFSKEPVKPGESGKISIEFHSEGFPGRFHKTFTVYTNEPRYNKEKFYIRGEVIPKNVAN